MSLIHQIVPVGPLQCNCSIIGDPVTHEAIVIDPGDDVADILKIVREHNLRVTTILITHAHIDHVGGAMKLKAQTAAPVLMNQNDQRLLAALDMQAAWIGIRPPEPVVIDAGLADGARVGQGTLSAHVIHTPGHTEGSVCLLLDSGKTLIAGDTLFAGSIGRTDLPGGSFQKIMNSLHDRLLQLPDNITVVPGHGRLTSIGEERHNNPFLSRKGII
jgi:hydroxyacylglutathione hydrolase